jgi:CubicO group peptidase (beta-lactamase class C family)
VRDDDGFEDTVLARIDRIVEGAVEQGQAPGVVAGVARGERVHVATAGVMAVGGPPMRRDTLFRISSNTKPMTAVVVLSLIDDGVIALDEPVERLLPNWRIGGCWSGRTDPCRRRSRRSVRSRCATY